MTQVRRLAAAAPQPGSQVADDAGNVLARTYRARGLTAVLVRADDSVDTTVLDITVRDAERDRRWPSSSGHSPRPLKRTTDRDPPSLLRRHDGTAAG